MSDFDPRMFRDTLGHFPTGVVVVTAMADDGTPAGMVIGAFTSVSLDPPLVAFLPTRGSRSFEAMRTAQSFCVNVLSADQQDLCRQFATAGADKYEGVEWTPAPSGAPILPGVVAWIDCEYDQVIDAGDHHIVIGAVKALDIPAPALPLVFFQGGYGRFSPGSLVARPDPHLIESVRRAESVRSAIEDLAEELGIECSVLSEVGDDAVCVASANWAPRSGLISLGAAIPLMPPLGSVFHTDSPSEDMEAWLNRAPGLTDEDRDLVRANVDKVRERGYSCSLREGHPAGDEFESAFVAYASGNRLPHQERQLRTDLARAIAAYEPEIVPGESYDVHSVVVAVPSSSGLPRMALRLGHLPERLEGARLLDWIERVKAIADRMAPAR